MPRPGPEVDFWGPFAVRRQVRPDQLVRAYFPVYEIRTSRGSLSRFVGFRPMPELRAAYRARTPEKIQLPFSLALPSHPEDIRYHQSLGRLIFGTAE